MTMFGGHDICHGRFQLVSSRNCLILAKTCVKNVSYLKALTAHIHCTITADINEVERLQMLYIGLKIVYFNSLIMYMSLKLISTYRSTAHLPSLTKGRLGQGGWLRGLATYPPKVGHAKGEG